MRTGAALRAGVAVLVVTVAGTLLQYRLRARQGWRDPDVRASLRGDNAASSEGVVAARPAPPPTDFQLRPFEAQSIPRRRGEPAECTPPFGVPDYCCLGSLSEGGGVNFYGQRCAFHAAAYEKAMRLALQETAGRCDICDVLDILLRHGLRVAIIGDSVNYQSVYGFECELHRRNYSFTRTHSNRKKEEGWRFGMGDIDTYEISRGEETAEVVNYVIYRPSRKLVDVDEVMSAGFDVVMLNFGVHWTDRAEYETDMAKLFHRLWARRSGTKLLVWRETTAQHFANPGGEFTLAAYKAELCKPVRFADHGTGAYQWRDATVAAAARKVGFDVRFANDTRGGATEKEWNADALAWIPFYNFTLQLSDLHPRQGGDGLGLGECTHFCSTPHLWMPIWKGLRVSLERAAAMWQRRRPKSANM